VWVVGKRHHHEPVRWIRSGRTVAYVPVHPRDLTGKVPINAKNDVFAVSRKDGISSVAAVRLGPERSAELLAAPPREFRTVYLRPLARAEEPRMEARTIKDAMAGKTLVAGGVPITFDRKTQSFTMPVHIMEGNRMVTVSRAISAHSTSGSTGARAGGSGGSRGGGSSNGTHGSSASSGGGSHASAASSAGSSGSSSSGSHH
jgi:hypothetical protein